MVLDFIMLGRQEVDKTSPSRRAGPTLEVSQFDQTFDLAASMIVNSKEASRTLERSRFLLQVRLQNGNRIGCSRGAVFNRWRGLGIFSLARLDRPVRTNACPAA